MIYHLVYRSFLTLRVVLVVRWGMKPVCTGLKSKFELRKWNNERRYMYCRMVKRTNSIAMQPGSVHE